MSSLYFELPDGRCLFYGNKVEHKSRPERYEAEAFEIICLSRFGSREHLRVVGTGPTLTSAVEDRERKLRELCQKRSVDVQK